MAKAETGHATAAHFFRNCEFYRDGTIKDIETVPCARRYVVEHRDRSKTAYLHYVDGMTVWAYCPNHWKGWKIIRRQIGEREVY